MASSSHQAATRPPSRFGTFTGVFTPTLLTILGVIMYVRIGWVVGNAGLLGAWAVMGLAMLITTCTGLSLSSIATNTRIGDGGPYAIISKSLGLEVGGSIGVPLYLTRPLGIAMYIIGFREGWQWIFPSHHAMAVDICVFGGVFALAYLSANLAFRVQFFIMAVIVVSLVSVVASPETFTPSASVTWLGDYPGMPEDGFQGADFWLVFAVFFPATTGILAGANMSGDLHDPRRAIPVGTLWAIAISSCIYFLIALWVARAGTMEELASNYTLLIDKALWGPAVLAGLLGATFSSALAGAVGGPRILMAMGEHRLLPASRWLASRTGRGEPRNAVLVTAALTLACLMARDLNVIAPLVTMFFLLTYLVINVVLLIENSLGLTSFRPSLHVPTIVPLLGSVGCVFSMFVVSPTFGLFATATSFALYVWLQHQGVGKGGDDVRSSIFVAVADWAATKVHNLGMESERAWKPYVLLPTEDPDQLRGEFELIADLCYPEGCVKILGLATGEQVGPAMHRVPSPSGTQEVLVLGEAPADSPHTARLRASIQQLAQAFNEEGIFSATSLVHAPTFTSGTVVGLEALQSAFFRPNLLVMNGPEPDSADVDAYRNVVIQSRATGVGIVLLKLHPKAHLGRRKNINLWIQPDRGSWDANDAFDHNNIDLAVLLGYRIAKRWRARLRIITAVRVESDREAAGGFLDAVCELARIPDSAERIVLVGPFEQCAEEAPQAAINIMGLQPVPDFAFMHRLMHTTHSSCLFVADSGRESARA